MIRTELTHAVYLELAAWYLNLGLEKDVITLLSLAPEQPEILYWRAWLANKENNSSQASEFLKKANAGDPSLVFPFLQESIEPLTWALENSTTWKPAYYLGLIYWNSNKTDKAKALFQKCGDTPDFYPFYLARVELFKSADPAATEKDLLKAVSLAPDTWRTGLQLSKFYEKQKQYARSKQVAAEYFGKFPQNYYLGLNFAKQLSLNGENEACVNLLAKLKVLPNEGATAGYNLWRESNLKVAMDAYTAKNYKKALKFIAQSRTWPENLGVGKPYDIDERFPDFLSSICYKAMGNKKKAAELDNAVMVFTQSKNYKPAGSADLLSAWLLRKNGEDAKAASIIAAQKKRTPAEKNTRWVDAMYTGDKNLASAISTEEEVSKTSDPYQTVVVDTDFSLMLKLSSFFNF